MLCASFRALWAQPGVFHIHWSHFYPCINFLHHSRRSVCTSSVAVVSYIPLAPWLQNFDSKFQQKLTLLPSFLGLKQTVTMLCTIAEAWGEMCCVFEATVLVLRWFDKSVRFIRQLCRSIICSSFWQSSHEHPFVHVLTVCDWKCLLLFCLESRLSWGVCTFNSIVWIAIKTQQG